MSNLPTRKAMPVWESSPPAHMSVSLLASITLLSRMCTSAPRHVCGKRKSFFRQGHHDSMARPHDFTVLQIKRKGSQMKAKEMVKRRMGIGRGLHLQRLLNTHSPFGCVKSLESRFVIRISVAKRKSLIIKRPHTHLHRSSTPRRSENARLPRPC